VVPRSFVVNDETDLLTKPNFDDRRLEQHPFALFQHRHRHGSRRFFWIAGLARREMFMALVGGGLKQNACERRNRAPRQGDEREQK
jgi:hypothetical protein